MALGAPFHCCRLTHWMPRLAASTPLGLVLERQSSQAKDGFVESKKVSIVFRAELTAGDERAARLSPKTRTPPESALGAGLGNPHLVVYEGLLLRGLRFANSRTRPNLPHGTSCCGIFATLGEYSSPITLLGDFPVRMSQLEHVGGRAHGCRDDSIDCDSGVRCRFCAGPLGRQARPLRRCEIEEGTVSDFASAPNQACCLDRYAGLNGDFVPVCGGCHAALRPTAWTSASRSSMTR